MGRQTLGEIPHDPPDYNVSTDGETMYLRTGAARGGGGANDELLDPAD